ncbi:MAG TPA: LysR family transcriptional regulator [Burkholderiaceae bacterium]|nr:LysR family transcriptional regulator [Burkholderiaceae bacterium]
MNLSTLITLHSILKYESFTAAGESIGLSASAVSLQVKQLEQYFGKPLFDRSTRQIIATPFAHELAEAAGSLLTRLEALRVQSTFAVEGNISVGFITSMQAEFLPDVLRTLRDLYPSLITRVPALNDSDELLAELKAGRIDAAIVVRPSKGGSRRLHWQNMYSQPYVMLAPGNTSLRDPASLLKQHEWVAYDSTISGGQLARRYVRRIAPSAKFTVELRSIDTIVAMVALGLGVTVIPRPRRPLIEGYNVRVIQLGSNAPSRIISLVCRKSDMDDRRINAVAQAFKACVDLMNPTMKPKPSVNIRRPSSA